MENSSLPSDVLNATTSEDDDVMSNLIYVRNLALKIVYVIIGTVGIIDNLFVIVIFIFFIKITDKVFANTLSRACSLTVDDFVTTGNVKHYEVVDSVLQKIYRKSLQKSRTTYATIRLD